jgi:hypothetical protein
VESACAFPARLFLDVIAATDMRVMRFFVVFIRPGGILKKWDSIAKKCMFIRYFFAYGVPPVVNRCFYQVNKNYLF